MAVIKTISLSYAINEKLRKEFNASGLIEKLLRDYYKMHDPEMIEEEKERLEKEEIERKEREKVKRIQEACMEGDEDKAMRIARGEE